MGHGAMLPRGVRQLSSTANANYGGRGVLQPLIGNARLALNHGLISVSSFCNPWLRVLLYGD